MTDLDDPASLRAADPGGMLDLVVALPAQCRDGWERGSGTSGLPFGDGVSSIAFCGMGGSAVAGDVLRAVYAPRLGLPVIVVRSPELPEFCGPHTLVLVSSYSGNTAEALGCFEEAVERGCRVVAVTSGGELARLAAERGVARVEIPGSLMPRSALGYLALGALGALEAIGMIPPLAEDLDETIGAMDGLLAQAGPYVPAASNPAKALALRIGERVPVIWGAEGIGAVAATRWKTQCNENAKVPAFAAALPELDHNEVVGWSEGRGTGFFLVALRHDGEHPEVAARFPLSMEIARSSGLEGEEVWARGDSPLSRLLTLLLQGDLVSTYLGIARGVDPTPIEAIVRLKEALSQA